MLPGLSTLDTHSAMPHCGSAATAAIVNSAVQAGGLAHLLTVDSSQVHLKQTLQEDIKQHHLNLRGAEAVAYQQDLLQFCNTGARRPVRSTLDWDIGVSCMHPSILAAVCQWYK